MYSKLMQIKQPAYPCFALFLVCLGYAVLDGTQPLCHLGQHDLLLRIYVHLLFRLVRLLLPGHSPQCDEYGDILVHVGVSHNRTLSARGGRTFLLHWHAAHTQWQGAGQTEDHSLTVQVRRTHPATSLHHQAEHALTAFWLCICPPGGLWWTHHHR